MDDISDHSATNVDTDDSDCDIDKICIGEQVKRCRRMW